MQLLSCSEFVRNSSADERQAAVELWRREVPKWMGSSRVHRVDGRTDWAIEAEVFVIMATARTSAGRHWGMQRPPTVKLRHFSHIAT